MKAVVHQVSTPERAAELSRLEDYTSEQALLAALLNANRMVAKVRDFLRPEHFADALHGRIYDAICRKVDAGEPANVVTLKGQFAADAAFDTPEGGARYLAQLHGAVVTIINADDYGRVIHDLALRRMALVRLEEAREATLDLERDLPAIVAETQGALTDTLAEMPRPERAVHGVDRYAEAVRSLYRGERKPKLSAGWPALDRHYVVRAGELTIVTGYPNAGKSEWVDAVCMNLAEQHGWKFALCSFETPAEEHIAALAEKYARQPFWPGPTARMSVSSLDLAMSWCEERFRFIRADDEAPTFDWLLRAADAAWQAYGINGLVIDPYNEIEHKRPPNVTEASYITDMLARLKRWAARRQVHVWFIAHPAKPTRLKDGSYPPLGLYDISGSQAWNSKADMGVIVTRKPVDGPGGDHVEIDVRKVRFQRATGCKPGAVTLDYDPVTGRYREGLPALPMEEDTYAR